MRKGFGFLSIIILAAFILSVAFGGGMYWNESKKQQSFLQTGADAKKCAEELKKQIESREESIYGGSTSINVDTSDWKTYRNEKYGFEVKYRGDWSVRASNKPLQFERVYITSPNGSYALIAPLGWPTGLPVSWKIEKVESNIGGKRVSIERFLTQDGIEWGRYIKFVDYPTSWKDFNFLFMQVRFISIETVCVEAVCGPKFGTIDANEKEILEGILSTFKFIK